MVDAYGDLCHLGILYLEDNKHPYKNFIEMNKDSQLLLKITTGGHFSDIELDSDYSRYLEDAGKFSLDTSSVFHYFYFLNKTDSSIIPFDNDIIRIIGVENINIDTYYK